MGTWTVSRLSLLRLACVCLTLLVLAAWLSLQRPSKGPSKEPTEGPSERIALGALPTFLVVLGSLSLAFFVSSVAARFLDLWLPYQLLPDLVARPVLITGCDSGFGHDAALRLDALGVPVFATCLFPEGPGAAALRSKASSRLRVLAMDVTSEESVAAACRAVEAQLQHGGLWAVVNNAGRGEPGEAEWMDLQKARDTMEVNAFGMVRVVQHFLPLLKKARGRVVNVTSLSTCAAFSYYLPYSMSKCATSMFTKHLRYEMAKYSISVHSIVPDLFWTKLVVDKYTTLSSPEHCPEHLRRNWDQERIQRSQDIGLKFIKFVAHPASKIHLVSDVILKACFEKYPQDDYFPTALGILVSINPWIAETVFNCIANR